MISVAKNQLKAGVVFRVCGLGLWRVDCRLLPGKDERDRDPD